LSCEQLAKYCFSTAVAGEDIWKLRAFSRLSSWDSIQKAAQASDERRREGRPKSQLDGIPLTVKANLAVEDHALTAGSKILGEGSHTNPIGYNAELVHYLIEDCGAVCIGITNMDEFGMGSLGTNCIEGQLPTKNPLAFLSMEDPCNQAPLLDILQQSPSEIIQLHENNPSNQPSHAAGGSSCGAAASIAHGSSLIALASDTGGSIRLPAAWCNVVGLKTSYGRISRNGLVSYASSLDTVGFLTRTVDCASMVMDEIVEKERERQPQDSTSYVYSEKSDPAKTKKEGTKLDNKPLNGVKIGIPSAFVVGECPDSLKEAWSQGAALLQEAGASVVTVGSDFVSPEVIQQSLAAYYVLASAEASSNLARYDGFRYGVQAETHHESFSSDEESTVLQRQYANTRTQGFGKEVIRRILCGTAVLSSDKFHTHYESAAKLRALVTKQLHDALTTKVDYLLIPTVVSPPPRLSGDDENSTVDSTAMFGNDIMTVPISLAGLSAVNVPFSLPSEATEKSLVESVIGLQLVGHRLAEANLLQVAQFLELRRETHG
jgi:aspartyl-tRNA(Asn)/glutamyl-tRNA(Gln) amidotransferase subunit A